MPNYTVTSTDINKLSLANLLSNTAYTYLAIRLLNTDGDNTLIRSSDNFGYTKNKDLLPALERLRDLGLIISYTLPEMKFTWRVKPTSSPTIEELKQLHQTGVFDGKGYLRYALWYESNKGAINSMTVSPAKMLADWNIIADDLTTWMSELEYREAYTRGSTTYPARGCILNDLTGNITITLPDNSPTSPVMSSDELLTLRKSILPADAHAYFACQTVKVGNTIDADKIEMEWGISNNDLFNALVTLDRRDLITLKLGDTIVEWLQHPTSDVQNSLLSELGRFFHRLGSLNPNQNPTTPINFSNLEMNWGIHRYDLIGFMIRLVNLELIKFDLSSVTIG